MIGTASFLFEWITAALFFFCFMTTVFGSRLFAHPRVLGNLFCVLGILHIMLLVKYGLQLTCCGIISSQMCHKLKNFQYLTLSKCSYSKMHVFCATCAMPNSFNGTHLCSILLNISSSFIFRFFKFNTFPGT